MAKLRGRNKLAPSSQQQSAAELRSSAIASETANATIPTRRSQRIRSRDASVVNDVIAVYNRAGREEPALPATYSRGFQCE